MQQQHKMSEGIQHITAISNENKGKGAASTLTIRGRVNFVEEWKQQKYFCSPNSSFMHKPIQIYKKIYFRIEAFDKSYDSQLDSQFTILQFLKLVVRNHNDFPKKKSSLSIQIRIDWDQHHSPGVRLEPGETGPLILF